MKRYSIFQVSVFILVLIMRIPAFAQIPNTLNYQGLLTDFEGRPVPDGTHQLIVNIYEVQSGGNPLWTETLSNIPTVNGVFSVVLGKNMPLTSLAFDKPYWLGISVDGGNEFSPRTELTSVSYAHVAEKANALSPNAKGVVTNINGTEGAITLEGGGGTTINKSGQIITISSSGGSGTGIQGVQNTDGNLSIQNPNGPTATINLSDNISANPKGPAGGDLTGYYPNPSIANISWGRISGAPSSMPPNGPAGGDLSGSYPNPTIANISWSRISGAPTSMPPSGPAGGDLTGTYPNPEIGNGKITGQKISDGAISNSKISDLAWGKITGAPTSMPPSGQAGGDLTGTYPNPEIGDGKITAQKIADGTITNSKIVGLAWSKITGAPASFPPSGSAGGDLSGTYPNPQIKDAVIVGANIKIPFSISGGNASPIFSLANTGNGGAISAKITGGGNAGYFETDNSSASSAVRAIAQQGPGCAIYAANNSSSGNSGYFYNSLSSNNSAAVYAKTIGGGYAGCFVSNNYSNTAKAIYAVSEGYGTAIRAEHTGTGYAGYFSNSNSGNNYAALYVTSSGDDGLVVGAGSKHAVVRTSQGARLLSCEESSEIWFSDYGFGMLENGEAVIRIDPLFAETVNLTEKYHVFIQVRGNATVYVCDFTPTQFNVKLVSGEPNVEFSYKILAKRKGFENKRLEHYPYAEDDPNLYPEKRAEWEEKNRKMINQAPYEQKGE